MTLQPTTNDVVPGILAPDVAVIGTKRDFKYLKVILLWVVIGFILAAFIYLRFFFNAPNKSTKSSAPQEIVTKSWSLRAIGDALIEESQVQDEPVNIKTFPALSNKHREIVKKRAAFEKYKSIPTNSSVYQGDESSTLGNLDSAPDAEAVIAASIPIDPDFLLPEGTYIPCSLNNRFVSEVAGRIQCMINQDVYSSSGRVKLIERGTKAIGMYQTGSLQYGMSRMYVIWTKLLTPDHKRVNLVDTQVVDRLGEAGIDGRVNSHFLQRFGGALMMSLIKDLVANVSNQHTNNSKRNTININSYEHTKDSTTSIVERLLESSVNIPPTMYKKQGDIIGIEIGKDIDFSKIYQMSAKYDKY